MFGMDVELATTYVNIVLYALSYQLQRPVEPYLVRSLVDGGDDGDANRTYGRLTSFFSFLQTIGSPLVGILLDRIGPKKTSILVYAASAWSYWILANATSMEWLFWSKVPAMMQHAFLVGQATVVRVAGVRSRDGDGGGGGREKDEDGGGDGENNDDPAIARAAALGRMTTAYTIGATVGPALGGYLVEKNRTGGENGGNDLYAAARWAVWGSLISVILSAALLRDRDECGSGGGSGESDTKGMATRDGVEGGHKDVDDDEDGAEMERLNPNPRADDAGPKPLQIDEPDAGRGVDGRSPSPPPTLSFLESLRKTMGLLLCPDLAFLLFVKVAGGVSSSAYSTVVPLVLMEGVGSGSGGEGMSPAELGRVMSAGMMSVAVFGAVGIGPAMRLAGGGKGKGGNAAADRLGAAGLALRSAAVIGFALAMTGSSSSSRPIFRASAVSVIVALASHAHATSLTALTTGSVPRNERGALLGLEHGLFSMARIAGPPLGTRLLSSSSFSFFGLNFFGGVWTVVLVCAVTDLCLAIILIGVRARRRRRRRGVDWSMALKMKITAEDASDHEHSD